MIDMTAIIMKVIDQAPTILTVLGGFALQWRTGKRREKRTLAAGKADAAAITAKVDNNTKLTEEVHAVVNGPHTEALRQNLALSREVVRLADGGKPTPHGDPTPDHPVTMKDNVPTVEPKP